MQQFCSMASRLSLVSGALGDEEAHSLKIERQARCRPDVLELKPDILCVQKHLPELSFALTKVCRLCRKDGSRQFQKLKNGLKKNMLSFAKISAGYKTRKIATLYGSRNEGAVRGAHTTHVEVQMK